MIIYADLRSLIVTGIVLYLTNLAWNYPLPLQRKLQQSGKRMVMTKKSCQDSVGNVGTCMFKYDCIRQKGVTLSTCVDGFLFGACCLLKENPVQIIPEDIFSESIYSNKHQDYNNSISDFTKFITSIDSKNSTEYISTPKEINKTSFLYLSSDNVHVDPSSNSYDLSNYSKNTSNGSITFLHEVNESTTFIYPISSSKFPTTESNSVINSTESREELETSHEFLDVLNQGNSELNNTRNDSYFETSTDLNGTEASESSLRPHLTETKNQFMNISNLEIKEDDKVTSVDYLEIGSDDVNLNMLDRNVDFEFNSTASASNSTDFGFFLDNSLLENGNQVIEKNSEFDAKNNSSDTAFVTNLDQLEMQTYNKSTSSLNLSSAEISFPPKSEILNKTTQYEISNEEYNHQNENNSNAYDEDFATTSELIEIIGNTFESSTRNLNFEKTNLELTTALPLELLDHSIRFYSTDFVPDEMLYLEQTTTDLVIQNEDTFSSHDIPLKMSSKTTDRFITDSIPTFPGLTSNEKIASKTVPLPTLPWSSHSILPESLQSVISQLTVQEESSPAISNLNIETQVDSTIDLNEFSTKKIFLDSEESLKSELQGDSFEIFNNTEESFNEKNYSFFELNQTYNSQESISNSLNKTNSHISTVIRNNTTLNDRDQNVLLIPNSVFGNLSIHKLSTNLTQVPNDDTFSRVNLNTTLHELNQSNTTVRIIEHSPNASENEKFEEDISSISFLDKLTKPLKSNAEFNFTSHKEENTFPSEIELYTFSDTDLQNKTNNVESEDRLTTINPIEQNSVATPHSQISVRNPSLNSSLFKVTEFTDVWTESLELESFTSTLNSLDVNFSENSNSLAPVQGLSLTTSLPEIAAFTDPWTEDADTESSTTIIQIINNHVGKNLSVINFSNKVKDANEPHVNTIVFQPENAEPKENITPSSIVNNNQYIESSSSLQDSADFIYTPSTAMQPVEDAESTTESVHSIADTLASSIYLLHHESTDSSQSTTLGTTPANINFNLTRNFSSLSISNSASPAEIPSLTGTENLTVQSLHSEELVEFVGSSTSLDIKDKDNVIYIETSTNKHPEVSIYTDINTESSSDVKLYELIVENSSLTDSLSNVQITSEINDVDETLYTTPKEEFYEPVTTPALSALLDSENFTTSGFLKPMNTHSSDNFTVIFSTEPFSYNTFTPTETVQNVDVMTDDKLSENNLHESSSKQSVKDSTIAMQPTLPATETTSIDFTSQVGVTTTNVDNLTYLSTKAIKTQVPTTATASTTHAIRWNYKKDCGVRLMQPIGRIVGGKNTYFGKWPWQALVKEATWLGLFVKNKCGGVLITSKYILTAAHCQPGFFASLLVVLGTHDLAETFDNKASVIRNVKRMVVHRHYNAQTFENDLALLEMESPVEFLPYVVPICLPHRNEDFTGKMAFVTGWGKLTHGGDVPNILQEVQVPIVTNGDCQRMFFHAGHHKAIRSNFVCAGYSNGGQDSCEGDSGGPLMVQREDKRWVLVGTVSHGIGCADPNLPGVYMRMSSYRPWIDSIIYK